MRSSLVLLALMAATPAGAQQVAGRVYELSEVEVLPRPQNLPEFRAALEHSYPPNLRDAGVDGTVHVVFVVGVDGRTSEVRVLSATDSSFSSLSVQAVSLLRFTPAQVDGQPVAVRVEQPITWRAEAPSQVAAADFTGAGAPAAADTADGYQLPAVEEMPRVLNVREFARELARSYPPPLRDEGVEGLVQVRFRVERDGTTNSATIVSTTDPAFSEPSLRAVEMLRFRPGRVAGRPVRTWVEQPIYWTVARGGPVLEGMEQSRPGSKGTEGSRRGRLSDIIPGSAPRTCDGRPCP